MIRNYIKIAWRNLVKSKSFSILNIAGLSVGMACSILILTWVQNEVSYDQYHSNSDELYRLTCQAGEFKSAVTPAAMAPELKSELPEVAFYVRLTQISTALFEVNNQSFEETRVIHVDSNFLQVFDFPLLRGDAKTALKQPNGLLITEAMSQKYFGNLDALGKVIKLNNSDNLTVTGILAKLPSNSHLQFDFVIPMSNIANTNIDLINNAWNSFNFYCYIQLAKGIDLTSISTSNLVGKINKVFKAHNPDFDVQFQLQPLTDIHLHSDLQVDVAGHGNIQYVNIFFIVALIILVVACINFMNLATARSSKRSKEVGLRKAVGAARGQLILQFLSESLLISFISILIAIGLVFIALPYFNVISGKHLFVNFFDVKFLISLLGIMLVTGLLSGSYPALFLSGFNPVKVLKGKLKINGGNLLFRNSLVIVQFIVSAVLIVGTAVVYNQLNFIKNKNLGFDKSNLLSIPMKGEILGKEQALKNALELNPLTSTYSIISDLPSNLITGNIDVLWEGKDLNSVVVIPSIKVDENFIDVFQIDILSGRGFSKKFSEDNFNYVINEKMVKLMGKTPEDVIGETLSFSEREGPIVGVVKNFNFKPLQYNIEPLVLRKNYGGGIVVIRAPKGNTETTIKALESIYDELNPAYPFTYDFIDQDLENQYRGEQQMGTIFNVFAILAIFISCLGMYGLSAFMAEQRTKEIGIRKILGASTLGLVNLLSKDLFKLALIALLVAIPLSWYYMNEWLTEFAFHINITWWMFIASAALVLLTTLLTISYQAIRTALGNPVDSLKYD